MMAITSNTTPYVIVLPISLNMCFGCSKEPSHRDGSLEYPQHMFWVRNKKNDSLLRTLFDILYTSGSGMLRLVFIYSLNHSESTSVISN